MDFSPCFWSSFVGCVVQQNCWQSLLLGPRLRETKCFPSVSFAASASYLGRVHSSSVKKAFGLSDTDSIGFLDSNKELRGDI